MRAAEYRAVADQMKEPPPALRFAASQRPTRQWHADWKLELKRRLLGLRQAEGLLRGWARSYSARCFHELARLGPRF
jgi:hypothetical protein